MNHKTVTIPVLVDVDAGVAPLVAYLNTIPGVRTHASCESYQGDGRPGVLVTWDCFDTLARLKSEFDVSDAHTDGANCYVHPRIAQGGGIPTPAPRLDKLEEGYKPALSLDASEREALIAELRRAPIEYGGTASRESVERQLDAAAELSRLGKMRDDALRAYDEMDAQEGAVDFRGALNYVERILKGAADDA